MIIMEINPSTSSHAYDKNPVMRPKAGGKSIGHLLNIPKDNLPQNTTLKNRTIKSVDNSRAVLGLLKVLQLRRAIFTATTTTELNMIKSQISSINNEEEEGRLKTMLNEKHALLQKNNLS